MKRTGTEDYNTPVRLIQIHRRPLITTLCKTKTVFMKTQFLAAYIAVFTLVIAGLPQTANAQTAPIFNFNSVSLESGTALTAGAVYRFSNVASGVDALVTISTVTPGITLRNIDRTADGYGEAFQPEYRISSGSNAYIDFQIRFVTAGTTTTSARPLVNATGLDIDGSPGGGSSSLMEFNSIDMGGGTYEFNSYNTEINVSQTGTTISGTNSTGKLFGALVDTSAKEVMFSVTNTNVGTMTYRVGSNNQTSSTSTRYASLYFKKFTFQHFPLAVTGLISFEAVTRNNTVAVSWSLQQGKYSTVTLEKSNDANVFTPVYTDESAAASGNYSDAAQQQGQVFYRLIATGVNGKKEYSSVVTVRFTRSATAMLNVYPTLIHSAATVGVEMKEKAAAQLVITDFSGRILKQQQLNLQAGQNNLAIDGFDNFAKGNYIVALRTPSGMLSKQVVVQ